MDFQPVRPDLVRFEMRRTVGEPIGMQETRRPGGFGRFMSGMGKFLGTVAMPLSFVFPPAALAAAGMYGVGGVGDIVQQRAFGRAMEQQAKKDAFNQVVFPGMGAMEGSASGGGAPGFQPASVGAVQSVTPKQDEVMEVLFARDAALNSMAQGL